MTWITSGFDESTLINCANGKRTVTASMSVRTARMVNVGVDDFLGGKFLPPGECPRCGYRGHGMPERW